MNYRPLTIRKKAQLLMVMTLVVWATTLLLHQWGYGAEVTSDRDSAAPPERFIAPEAHPVNLALRSEITVHGTEVKFRQLCRWANSDAQFFAPMADLIIARCKPTAPFQSVSIDEIRNTLHDAGVNVALIRFNGPTNCTIARSDVQFDERQALQDWIDAKQGKAQAVPASASASVLPAKEPVENTAMLSGTRVRAQSTPTAVPPTRTEAGNEMKDAQVLQQRTLRDLIVADAAVRLNVPAEQLQLTFNPKDERLLSLPESQFKFNLDARRVYNLGDVAWDVLIVTDGGSRKAAIAATARAWEKQVVVAKPLGYKQVIRAEDVNERRVLVDHLPDEPLLAINQAVGQQAARELKPGMILSARMVDPVQLIKTGQFVTITLNSGKISVKTVVRALESGSYGQTIRVKNESTRDTYEVVVTGPQEGALSPVPEERRVADAGN